LALLTVLLADGLNMGLGKMARACQDYSVWELTRVATWHVRQETYERALAMVVAAQAALPMARLWGEGLTSSSDGQFFPSGSRGDALNLVNARYGSEPGTKLYTHVSDQYAPFHVNQITATAFEAPYVLDGLVNTDAGRRVQEHFTDTGGFTDHVFAIAAILGFAFAPRIRNLPDKRLYVFDRGAVHPALAPLVGRQVRTDVIRDCWPEILRIAASMVTGAVVPSHLLRKLAAYPKRNALAIALREIGRIERSIFILTWLIDTALQRRQQLGLNKGEAHHALKSALCLNRKGEIRDRSSDRQAIRAAGLNFLAAVVIYHNTFMLGEILANPEVSGTLGRPDLLTHAPPLCWDHILLTGEYSWSEHSIPISAPKT
jgi:TnpA family transposase